MPGRLTPRGQAASPVEPNVAAAAITKKAPKKRAARKVKDTPGAKYVRNLHAIPCRCTLTTGREIQLKPRGEREDLDIVTLEEQDDPRFIANENLLFEVIEPAQAKAIIAKQQTNSKAQEHPLWNYLRNEKGEQYEQREVHVETAYERQGTVVARVEQTGSGRFTDKNFEVVREAGPQFVDVPGSPGHPATAKMLQQMPDDISPEDYHEFLLWKRFKAAMAAQPSAEEVRDSLNVTVEPLEVEDEPSE